MPIDINDLSEAEVERVVNTPIFRRALAYKRLADGIEALEQDDEMLDQLARDVNAEAGGRTKVATTKGHLKALVTVVDKYTSLVDEDTEAPEADADDLSDLIVDEDEDDRDD